MAQRGGGGMGGGGGMHGGGGGMGGGVRGGGGISGGGYRGGSGGTYMGGGNRGVYIGGYRNGGYGFTSGRGYYGGYYGRGYYGGFYGGYWPYYYPYWGLGFGYSSWPYYDYGYPAYDYGYPYYGDGYSSGYAYNTSPNVTVVYPQQTQPATSYAPPAAPARPVTREYDQYGQEVRGDAGNASPIYLIAFKDKVIRAASAYWLDGTTLHYVTLQREEHQAPVDTIDRDMTQRLNRERNTDFHLPQ
jgi:hypothetical protein